ncbi:MAG: glutamate synthase [Gammaproteobacteria bacterium]|nr:glutamate synthase [Gammaproteobacteria bacterium]
MHVAGVLVRTRPEDIDAVSSALRRLEGVEVHAATPDGRFIVTVEATESGHAAARFADLQLLPFVLSAALVYEHSETDPGRWREEP